ncbi:hypothetical protein GCM10008022_32340 [Paenibacillus hunanensis]|nr:hypothetical protein GCM10008022_32340 [Paenibacillus hunanensis]
MDPLLAPPHAVTINNTVKISAIMPDIRFTFMIPLFTDNNSHSLRHAGELLWMGSVLHCEKEIRGDMILEHEHLL